MWWLIVVGVFSMVALLAMPMFTRRKRINCGPTEVTNNAWQLGIALLEFEAEYGKFPDVSTAAEVKRRRVTPLSLAGNSSNDILAQMIAAGICQSESMFYAKAKGAVKPDNIMDTDASVLSHGECGFAYISNVDATTNPSTPLLFGPIIPGTRSFDAEANDGKAIILKLDSSVSSLRINSAGQVMYLGLELLDPKNPIWGGKAPDVKWPK